MIKFSTLLMVVYYSTDFCGTFQYFKDTVPSFVVDFQKGKTVMCYRTYIGESIQQCIKNCLSRRERCQFIRHNRRFRICSICDESPGGYEFGDVLIDVSKNQNWFGLIDRTCASVSCERTKQCVYGKCVHSECELPSIVKGTIYPTHIQTSVGTKLRFYCLDNTIAECPIIRECQSNAIWTDSEIESVRTGTGNVALGKQANQSTTYFSRGLANRDIYPTAELAVDGNTNGVFRNGSCTHTTGTKPTWWLVDLDDIFWISRVVIYNRVESPERLRHLNITIGVTLSNMLFCAYFEGPGKNRKSCGQ